MALKMGKSLLLIRLKEAGVSPKELADYLNVSKSFISMVVSGERHFNLERAVNAANYLNCEVMSLYEWERK